MDAFFQCYQDKDGVRFVLNRFFEHGGNQVYLISDGGADYSDVAKEFGSKIIYVYSPLNVKVGYWKHKSECLEWFERVKNACEVLKDDRIMILEEDVLINGDLKDMPLEFEIAGPRFHTSNRINPEVNRFIASFGKVPGNYLTYGGCGGSIFNRKIFIDNYTSFTSLLKMWYEHLDAISHGLIRHQDYCLTLMFILSGYPYGSNPEYTEPLYGSEFGLTKFSKKIIHHFNEA